MAVDKLVDSTQLDADLTSIANAIRTKGGTSASLAFPSGFVSAIGDISSGYTDKQILTGVAPSGEVNLTLSANLPMYAICGRRNITKLTINFGSSYGFAVSNGNGYNVTNNFNCSDYVFIGTGNKTIVSYVFYNNGTTKATFKGSWGGLSQNAFRGTNGMTVLDLSSSTGSIATNAFYSCNALKKIVIRRNSVMALSNTGAFTTSSVWKNGGGGGTLYVPRRLISSYQSASNWSTILGYSNNNIAAIEGSDFETKYADGSDCDIRYINQTLTNCTSSSTENSTTIGATYTTTIAASSGYTLDSVTVTMNGVDVTSTVYDSSTGEISIASVDGSISITATAS